MRHKKVASHSFKQKIRRRKKNLIGILQIIIIFFALWMIFFFRWDSRSNGTWLKRWKHKIDDFATFPMMDDTHTTTVKATKMKQKKEYLSSQSLYTYPSSQREGEIWHLWAQNAWFKKKKIWLLITHRLSLTHHHLKYFYLIKIKPLAPFFGGVCVCARLNFNQVELKMMNVPQTHGKRKKKEK